MIWDDLSTSAKPFFALAPMNDVTDSVFRQIVARCAAPDVFFSEFVSVDTLASPGKQAMKNKLAFTSLENPLIVQVWGTDPKNYEAQSRELSQAGYAGIDINMGCPVAKIVSKGACSALMNDRYLAQQVIKSTQVGAHADDHIFPVSVKTRIGFNEVDLTWIEFLLEQNLAALTVHCRTVDEMSNVPNHFEVLNEIVAIRDRVCPQTKIIANGDVATRLQGEKLADEFDLDGIMIGRGVFADLFIFSQRSPWKHMTPHERLSLYLDHIHLFGETWGSSKNPEVLKKFAKVYVVGFKGAQAVREQIMAQRKIDDVREVIARVIVNSSSLTC